MILIIFKKKKTFWKIFKKSVNLDQYQVCISNSLGARALQREALIYENAFLYRDCEIEMGNVFIQTNAISKPKKIAIPAWRQMKVLSRGFQMTYDFYKFFFYIPRQN